MSGAVDPALMNDFVECFVSDILVEGALSESSATSSSALVVSEAKVVYWTSEDHDVHRAAGFEMVPLDLSRFAAAATPAAAAGGRGEGRAAMAKPCHLWVKRTKRAKAAGSARGGSKAIGDVALVNELMCGSIGATRAALVKEGFAAIGASVGAFQLFVKGAKGASAKKRRAAVEPIVDLCLSLADPRADDAAAIGVGAEAPSAYHRVARRFDVPCAHLWLRRRPAKGERAALDATAARGGGDGVGYEDAFEASIRRGAGVSTPGLSDAAVTETLRRCVAAMRAHFRDAIPGARPFARRAR